MKGSAKVVGAIVVGIAILMVTAEPGHSAKDCQHVESLISPCGQYLTGRAASPSTGCCNGISNLKRGAPAKADRRAACECFTIAASHISGLKKELAMALPKHCGVDAGVTITPDTTCSDIN